MPEVLSDNILNQTQNNTVVVQQKEKDRVGFEPTTSAMPCNERIATLRMLKYYRKNIMLNVLDRLGKLSSAKNQM